MDRTSRDKHMDYDEAAVTPSSGTEAVGRVGGVDDESFAREDGAEARGADAAPIERDAAATGGYGDDTGFAAEAEQSGPDDD